MKIAIMQPYLFPYLGYFQLINCVDKFVIFDDVNFIKKGWINRNRIIVQQKEYIFTIPLHKVSQNKRINQLEISETTDWRKKLLTTIENSYKKAPSFKEVFPLLQKVLNNKENNLSRFLLDSIRCLNEYLDISTEIVESSAKYITNGFKGEERIIEICKEEQADNYVNLIGGRDLYNKDHFEENNIKLSFLKMNDVEYERLNQKFISSLSIIDVMMFNSTSSVKSILKRYTLL